MKLAVVTLHRVYNYGSVLQAYATQKVLEKKGHEVQIVDYITPQRTKKKIFFQAPANEMKKGIKLFAYRMAKIGSLLLKEKTFGSFIKKNLHLTKEYVTAEDLEKDPPIADIYITGSDQVWNSLYNEGIDRGFFLDFLPDESTRLAFVASFGKTQLDESEVNITKKYIQKYKGLSVREDAAKHILNKLGREDAIQLIDPTLQLTGDEWREIASKRLVKERYLILMLLYNEDNHATEYARKIADEKGLKLVKISWELKKPQLVDKLFTHRSPEDFLSLFANAEFVVTNSFHGLAFSINLHRQFVVVPRNEFNSRIESLLTLTGLNNRMVKTEKEVEQCMNTIINYIEVEEYLNQERTKANKFIEEMIQE